MGQVAALQQIAHDRFAPDSRDPGVIRQRNRQKLTCRERIDLLGLDVAALLDDAALERAGA